MHRVAYRPSSRELGCVPNYLHVENAVVLIRIFFRRADDGSASTHSKLYCGLGLDLTHYILQVHFNITHEDYGKLFNKRKEAKATCASDLDTALLQDVVDVIESVNDLSVSYLHSKTTPSRKRGGSGVPHRFLPDEPQEYTVCDTVYSLTKDLHNKLCLLRGLIRELLPSSDFLGSHLPEVVGYQCFLFYALLHCGSFFLHRRT